MIVFLHDVLLGFHRSVLVWMFSLVVHVSNRLSAWASPFEHDSEVFPVCKNRVQVLKLRSSDDNRAQPLQHIEK